MCRGAYDLIFLFCFYIVSLSISCEIHLLGSMSTNIFIFIKIKILNKRLNNWNQPIQKKKITG